MENEKTKVDHLIDHVEEYFKTRQELSKMIAAEKSSVIISSVMANLVILFVFFFVIVFASIALAYAISQYFGQAYAGFLAVALIYLIFGVILFVKQDQLLKTPMANAVIKNFFKTQDDEKD
ncbi:MAG: phage holin family protein [Bacteroidetes bacterium]|nr:phage holin family protein [Bacteroidota bacterium]